MTRERTPLREMKMRDVTKMSRVELLEQDLLLPSWYATRGRRRTLAGALVTALALVWADAAIVWNLGGTGTAFTLNLGLVGAALLLGLPTVTLLNAATRGTVDLAEHKLDERQVAERLRAQSITHRAMTAILGTALVATALATWGEGGDSTVPGMAVSLMTVALIMTHFNLPLVIAGWRLPDAPAEDPGPEGVPAAG